ncbi:hypothetical protein TNCV_3452721 [Trichonephila clavipes]|nr:hypothetical protein TNCV_3452721 [Trichonephila clavipes]
MACAQQTKIPGVDITGAITTARAMEAADRERLRKANNDILQNSKEARVKRRHKKCILQDTLAEEIKKKPSYEGAMLAKNVKKYFLDEDSLVASYVWIKNLFEDTPEGLSTSEEEIFTSSGKLKAPQGLLMTEYVISNHGQVTWTTLELAPLSPNYHTTPTEGRFSSRQI